MRGREEHQFAGYDSLETRKLIFRLLDEIGHGRNEVEAAELRAQWLRAIIRHSENGFAERMAVIAPCPPVEAYRVFTAITGVLGVKISKAVELLEETIRRSR
jgi:hypothetical protein